MTKETEIDKALADLLEGRAEESLPALIAYLESVIVDNEPCLCPNCKTKIVAPAKHSERIAAVRAWKELVLDKVKGNKKDRDPKEKAMDFKKALEEVGKSRQEREARAEKAGKLARMSGAPIRPPLNPIEPSKKQLKGTLKLKALGKKKVSQE